MTRRYQEGILPCRIVASDEPAELEQGEGWAVPKGYPTLSGIYGVAYIDI